MRYVIEGLVYADVVKLKQLLKAENIDCGETVGALAVYTNRINALKLLVNNNFPTASISAGKSYLEMLVNET